VKAFFELAPSSPLLIVRYEPL